MRKALYDEFTILAYGYNNDTLRMSAIKLREHFMNVTKSPTNVIDEDRQTAPKKAYDMLPDFMKPTIKP